MSVFTPGRRWQPAYYPFKKLSLMHRSVARIERWTKGLLFGCRMCGNCLLQETALICPMECPKGMRNGPCGGSSPEHCYVDETRPCVWYRIYERAEKMGRTRLLLEVLPPLDWDKVGADTWADGIKQLNKMGWGSVLKGLAKAKTRAETWNQFFREIRQPSWWQGDDQPHPAPEHEPLSQLEAKLVSGKFVVTAEIAPPLSASADDIVRKIDMLRGYIDAANFTDNPSATPRMSSLACSAVAVKCGIEPIMQIAARDRTRMGLQGEVIGAAAVGVRNILCITGDHPRQGPAPSGRMDIWDVDAIQMIWIIRRMRDEGRFLDGREIKVRPPVFIGAAGSPFASNDRFQAIREEKKVNAGAQFFQTNLVYDVEGFERYLASLDKRGVLNRVFMLAGITPIRSLRAAQAIGSVAGVKMPRSIVERIEKSADPQEEGIQIALEIIDKIKKLPGVNGIHIMAIGWESVVPRLVKESLLHCEAAP